MYQREKQYTTSFYTDLAKEAFYKSIYDIQQRVGFAFSFSHISEKQINKVLSMDWSGENYSKRIWKNTQELAQTVKEELLVNLLTGRTDREAAEIITYRFASGASKARRLVRTESNFISSELNHEAYKESGVAEYQYLATLDLRTSKICQELDKKIFKVSERKVGVNCNPMHPWCRSTTVAVIDREFLDMGMRSARDPETGKTIKVPASMNYKEWYEEFVKPKSNDGERGITNKKVKKDESFSINREVIDTNEYKRKFNGITENPKVDASIYKYAKAGLIHRDGTACEDLYILSNSTGKILGKNISSNTEFGVEHNESVRQAVAQNQGDLLGLHTHPDETPPTGSDFEVAYRRQYNIGIVACADGSVYTYKTSGKYVSARYIDETIEKYKIRLDKYGKKVYSDHKEAHLAALRALKKEGITFEAR